MAIIRQGYNAPLVDSLDLFHMSIWEICQRRTSYDIHSTTKTHSAAIFFLLVHLSVVLFNLQFSLFFNAKIPRWSNETAVNVFSNSSPFSFSSQSSRVVLKGFLQQSPRPFVTTSEKKNQRILGSSKVLPSWHLTAAVRCFRVCVCVSVCNDSLVSITGQHNNTEKYQEGHRSTFQYNITLSLGLVSSHCTSEDLQFAGLFLIHA